MPFERFIAIDWSGAEKANHYRGKIQIAIAEANEPPKLWQPRPFWTRQQALEALQVLLEQKTASLIGFDFSFAPPYHAGKHYLSGAIKLNNAKALWEYVDLVSQEKADLCASTFIARHQPHFYTGKACGPKSAFLQLRHCEQVFNAAKGGKPSSIFDCVGAAQVAKASFSGMRLLNRLKSHAAVWPFDAKPEHGSCIVEIYCRAFIQLAGLSGRKIRDPATLNIALTALNSPPVAALEGLNDDQSDALVAAAALRFLAQRQDYWRPLGLTPEIARCEGWTFGIK
jgi:hypothetical protein